MNDLSLSLSLSLSLWDKEQKICNMIWDKGGYYSQHAFMILDNVLQK
jgi:hypothetical protein